MGIYSMVKKRRDLGIELLTTQEVCEVLGITRLTFYRLIENGELKAKKIGRGYRVLKEDLLGYLKKGDKPERKKRR